MSGFFSSIFALNYKNLVSNSQLGVIHFDSLLVIRYFSSKISPNLNQQSFTVSYLINSCGLTLKSAESISKRVFFGTPERPDSILMLLKDHGFTNSHISRIVKQRPCVLLAYPKKSILPKFEFLSSIGVSRLDLSKIVYRNPEILVRSLERYLIPRCDILNSVLLCDEKVVKCLKRMRPLTMQALLKNFEVNVSLLRSLRTPQSSISLLVTHYPSIMCLEVGKVAEGLKKVLEMGFDPSTFAFASAFHVFCRMTPKTWEYKMEVYKRWGLSEDEIRLMFKKHPLCMIRSEESIMNVMNFLVCKMHWQPVAVVRTPVVLCVSLEKRIVPRCSVVKVLVLKSLIEADIPLSVVLIPSDKSFLERFVSKYQEQVPQLLDLFQGKIGLAEFGFGFDEKSGYSA